tara:strand:- start:84212 stop:84910 length:699 start_codon:yes stop_codon:yes gene_type:complete
MNSQETTSHRVRQDSGDAQRLHPHKQKHSWFTLVTLIWVALVGIGMSSLWEYQTTPGQTTESPKHWPADCLIKQNEIRPTLIMFAHPHCPCTRASIRELALLMAHCSRQVDAQVLFFKSSTFAADWVKTDLWSSAAAIPGVTVACDENGSEAVRFRAATSGYTLLYSVDGQLQFQGGITKSRGHSGDNAGRSALEAILRNGTPGKKQTFAFGCPLQERNEACSKENQSCLQQ